MKSTGMVRRIDDLGRIVIPREIRTIFDINASDPLEIFVEDGSIILRKYEPSCIFCGDARDNIVLDDKHVCKKCIEKLNKMK